jgi:uncharacterized protein YjcR
MPKELAYLIGGFALGLAVVFLIPTDIVVQEPDTSHFDSLLTEKDQRIRELNIFVDSILVEGNKVDTVYYKLENKLKKQYENVDTISNSDSLINIIKRSIHN